MNDNVIKNSPNEEQGADTRHPGRDERGRFVTGNPGGSGNPFARRVAALRSAMLDAVTEEDLQDIIKMVVTQARLGDLQAAKLVLQYVIGKPPEAVNPDTLDAEEWKVYQQRPGTEEMAKTMSQFPHELASGIARGMGIARVEEMRQQALAMGWDVDNPEQLETNKAETPVSRGPAQDKPQEMVERQSNDVQESSDEARRSGEDDATELPTEEDETTEAEDEVWLARIMEVLATRGGPSPLGGNGRSAESANGENRGA